MRALVATLLVLLTAGQVWAQERQTTVRFVGFTSDGQHYVIEKYDYQVGKALQVRPLAGGKPTKRVPVDPGEEKAAIARLTKRLGVTPGTSPASPDGRYVALGAQEKQFLDILIMKKPRIGRLASIRGSGEPGAGDLPDLVLKKAAWSPDGRWIVVVATERASAYERDAVTAVAFRPDKVKWFGEEEKP